MTTIANAARISKRIILSNLLTNDYSIAVTPLLSGRHGIGKSQVARTLAEEIGGVCITIEGGTLKEGEITGIPYQYKNEEGRPEFRFLPYYAVRRIQEAERAIGEEEDVEPSLETLLLGEENRFAREDLSFEEKMEQLSGGKVKPVILFFDEINRTDVTVFRELMNIILTRSVNGYRFPWWVFIIAAMNPSSAGTLYATNEMDPAQLDRFIKLKVNTDAESWLAFAVDREIDQSIIGFIANHREALLREEFGLEDEDKPSPSPRGWHMMDMILKGRGRIDPFFTPAELAMEEDDVRTIMAAKVGAEAAAMYYASLEDNTPLIMAENLFGNLKKKLPQTLKKQIARQSTAGNAVTTRSIIRYLTKKISRISEDEDQMKEVLARLSMYAKQIDDSSKLLFLTALVSGPVIGTRTLFDYVADIVDDELMDVLEYSSMNDILIAEDGHE